MRAGGTCPGPQSPGAWQGNGTITREEAMITLKTMATASAIALLAALPARAQQQAPAPPPVIPYGMSISMEAAKKAMAAAEAEAAKNNWAMAIAIVDTGGPLVMLHRLDNTQIGSVRVAAGKARTSPEFRRPTKGPEDAAGIDGGARPPPVTFGTDPAGGGLAYLPYAQLR